MDEKHIDYILKCMRATDVCMSGVQTALDCLIKQAKHNRRQKFINFALSFISLTALFNVISLKKDIRNKYKLDEGSEEEENLKGE